MEHHHRPGPPSYDEPGPPPPRYVMLSEESSINGGTYGQSSLRPPPGRRKLPRYQSSGNRRSESCGCLCWCCVFFLLILLAAVAAIVYFALILNPKPPSYSVSHLDIGAFDLQPDDLSIHAALAISVRAENPNNAIGIAYHQGSKVVVVYKNITLCSGKLPEFYQGHRNVTVIRVALDGKAKLGSGIETALTESQRTGSIPLDIFVRVPVTLRLVSFDLRRFTVNVNCMLVVDSLTPGKKIGIKSTKYKFNVEF